ncbi:Rho-GTPase-activating protein 8, partial [Dipsacomyces acuminosporus]
MLKFESSFWDNPGLGQQPRYERGPQRLYEKLEQGSSECDELLGFLRDRVAIEEMYANSLRQLAERKLSSKGFGRDEGATLKTAYRGLAAECLALSEAHSDLAIELTSSVIMPLRNFSSEHRARVRASWKLMDDTIRRASAEISQVDRNHRVYTQKASVAEQLRLKESPGGLQPGALPAEFEVKARPSMSLSASEAGAISARASFQAGDQTAALSGADPGQPQAFPGSDIGVLHSPVMPVQGELDVASIVLGNIALTRHEFHVMLQRMQTEVPQHDVKFGILGTFRGLISGESLAGWWCTNYPTVVRNEADAISVGQSMMNQGYLRFMGRGSQFQSRPNAYYQWKKLALEFQSDDDYDSDDEPLGNRTTHLGKVITYERAQREADEASHIYRDSVTRAELVRTDLEEQLTNYLDTMEVWELNRLMNIKSTLNGYARVSKLPIQAELAIGDRLEVYEESIKPQQDIQWTIEHYGTGRFTPRPYIFRPFSLSPAEYQVFGVSLEEQLLVSHKEIPLFPAKVLSLIGKNSREMAPEDKYKIWTTRALLKSVHELRNSVNRGSKVTLKQLRTFDLPVVANALVLYFLELPQPLCPDELYDPLRALYSSRSEKDSTDTMHAIRNLLQGLSYAHLKTIQAL